MSNRGVFTAIQNQIKRHRIGELLVAKGIITPQDLRSALRQQKQTRTPLGQIFLEQAAISKNQLRWLLCKQSALRICAATMLAFMSLTGNMTKKARADIIKDIPAQFQLVSTTDNFANAASYPALYGTKEKRSKNLDAFTKWVGMFNRFEKQLENESSAQRVREWQENLYDVRGASIKAMANRVNQMVNKKRYILDSRNWGKSDYWATPVEFLRRGGDCEDFAIMKYVALRSLGVPEDRLRVAIVQDTKKNIPHAVLVVYAETGAYILDNQNSRLISAETGSRYRPIYSINRQAWWLHTKPEQTQLASAAD